MSTSENHAKRYAAIHLLRSGKSVEAVAAELGRSVAWVYKWRHRFADESWDGLTERSRAPHQPARVLTETLQQAIRQARSELEAEASQVNHLHYVGAGAIQARLRDKGMTPPSSASIERVLKAAGLTHPRPQATPETQYPHLTPTQPQTLYQVDILPHYLRGGAAVACFNAVDVVSHAATGQAHLSKQAKDAVACLIHVWQTLGIPCYTQVDNEGCFSGGFTHPRVLGQVIRLALLVGTELVFSPFYHPQSNGVVERFHQDYAEHVWRHTELADVAAVNAQGAWFFGAYRTSPHVAALEGRTPEMVHGSPRRCLPPDFHRPSGKPPLTLGRLHFMRRVDAQRTVRVLNADWSVSTAQPDIGVWVTLEVKLTESVLYIYDAPPDVTERTCLASHLFPLTEPVQPQPAALTSGSPPTGILRGMTRQIWQALRRPRAV